MNPEAQRIAIAEACGWKRDKQTGIWMHPSESPARFLPDYLNDLNAMHEAIKECVGLCHADNLANLWNVCGLTRTSNFWTVENFAALMTVANATAAQRAEAFLRTLNLWTE